MELKYRPISEIIPYANNAKQHPPEHVDQIAASIREFGFNDPIAVDENNTVIEGHGRLLAAQKLGLEKVPIIQLSHLSKAQKKAYILAHNKLTLNTGFDLEKLQTEFQALKELDFEDLSLTGFNDFEIQGYFSSIIGATDVEVEYQGMPEFSHDDCTSFKALIVHFANEAGLNRFSELLQQPVTIKTKSIWFPPVQQHDTKNHFYANTDAV